MVLDQPTLLFTTALVLGFMGLLLILEQRPHGGATALSVWAGSMILAALGLVVSVTAHDVPWVGDGIGTAMLLGAAAMSWTAARLFTEHKPQLPAAIAGPFLWLVTFPLHAGGPGSIAASCLIGVAYTFLTTREIARTNPEPLPSRSPALVLLIIHVGTYAARAAIILVGVPTPPIVVSALILESLAHTVGMAFLLLAMVKERLELRSNEALRALARIDGLTGISNRRMLDERLSTEIRRATRRGRTLALLLIDVDRFKAYNDAIGHQKGDTCLRTVAQTIAAQVRRPGDLAARYGGEEFAVVLANTTRTAAVAMAEGIRSAIERLAIPHPGTGGVVTISIGVATFEDGIVPAQAETLIDSADQALYRAKNDGRNKVHASPPLPPGSVVAE